MSAPRHPLLPTRDVSKLTVAQVLVAVAELLDHYAAEALALAGEADPAEQDDMGRALADRMVRQAAQCRVVAAGVGS
ncbi:MAG: hypothetical protein QM621_14920 [Aeromicrobium sp.]|uniref:hypothetical protein n=1 Tax=Aeromicrobium sp. TaxID=1871063 RepID=UPI0039E28600